MIKLYEAKNHILIHTDQIHPAEHRHSAAHIIISMGEKMRVYVDGDEYQCNGIFIPSGCSHFINTNKSEMLVFLYDNTTSVATQMKETKILNDVVCESIRKKYSSFEKRHTFHLYKKFENVLLEQLGIEQAKESIMDERILSAIKHMRKFAKETLTCKAVADAVLLSESRFSHLFKEQVGMTYAAYLIYQRIMHVYMQVVNGKTITEAAIEAGFSSSSHFADVNRRVFGIPASDVIKDLEFIKIAEI